MGRFSCAVFDLDGVITRTASLHFNAWKSTFDEFLDGRDAEDTRPFTHEDDYIPYVDGKPRYDGVKSFLESRGIELPYGDPDDEPGGETVCAVGNQKNEAFRELVESEGVEIYHSTLDLIDEMIAQGIAVGVASSSRNCTYILEQSELLSRFGTVVDGNVSRELELNGKPAPDIFVVAAERLDADPYDSVMVEDAFSGVEAGWRGGFGLVIGVARNGGHEELLARGADIAVADMAETSLEQIDAWFEHDRNDASWRLEFHGPPDEDDRLREALCTVGNGVFATRGVLESERIEDNRHYPGTYIAGLFDSASTEVHGKLISNNDFVNCPNWVETRVQIDGSDYLSPDHDEVIDYHQWLDLRRAVLHRRVTFRDTNGRETRVEMRRFISMERAAVAAMLIFVTPLNHDDPIVISTALDGTVRNYGVERYRDLEQHHLEPVVAETRDDGALLAVRTRNSGHTVAMRSRTRLVAGGAPVDRSTDTNAGRVSESFRVVVPAGSVVTLEKLVAVTTDLHRQVSAQSGAEEYADSPARAAEAIAASIPGYAQLEKEHSRFWEELWQNSDLLLEGDRFAQRTIRLHVYHLLTTASPQTVGLDVGFPARGLHGEAYRGHIFWDELFIMPFFVSRFPAIARNHLMYRYRRLEKAREIAAQHGYAGAMYPWQSADTGEPESQELHYNPKSGKWDPDLSSLQRHIGISIAYNIWLYFHVTQDETFLQDYGMEMLVEITRFWSSIAEFDDTDQRYHIRGVMGPDEFHEKYSNASNDNGGLNDNAYTNVMASWLIHKSIETYEHLPNESRNLIIGRLDVTDEEIDRWRDITHRMALLIDDEYVISQFEGFGNLEELDWTHYREKHGDIRRMDRILKAEDDSPNRYQVIKQADVLMLFYLLAPDQVATVIERMGYQIPGPRELLRANYEYYAPRTSHGSTLSWVVHAAILEYLEAHDDDQWRWFVECLKSDQFDTQGGTTLEGIHCGVMAGSIDMIIARFSGVQLFHDHIELNTPMLADGWRRVRFQIRHVDQDLHFELRREVGTHRVSITRRTDGHPPLTAHVNGNTIELPVGKTVELDIRGGKPC